MRLSLLVLLLTVTAALGFPPIPPPKERKPKEGELSLKALEGTWTVVSYEIGRVQPKAKGKVKIRPPVLTKSAYDTIVIKDGQWVQKRTLAKGGTAQMAPQAITLDVSKSPATFDLSPARAVKAKLKGKFDTKVNARLGLARVAGDQLIVTYSAAGRDRPASVEGELTTGQYRWVLKRVKP